MGYIGYQLGLSVELTKLAGVLGGLILSFRYYQTVGDFLASWSFLSIEWSALAAMMTLFGLAYLALTLLLRWMEKIVKVTFESRINAPGGLILGLFRASLVMSVILVGLKQVPSSYLENSIETRSWTGSLLIQVAPLTYDACASVPRTLRQRLAES